MENMKKVKVSNAVGELILEGPEEVVLNVLMNYIIGTIQLSNRHSPEDCQREIPDFGFFTGKSIESLNRYVQFDLGFDLMEFTEVE
jgi:hypothetical protein